MCNYSKYPPKLVVYGVADYGVIKVPTSYSIDKFKGQAILL